METTAVLEDFYFLKSDRDSALAQEKGTAKIPLTVDTHQERTYSGINTDNML